YDYPYGSYYGSYYSGTNYGTDDENAVRNVLAEYTVSWNRHDMATFGRLFTENCDYVNIAGVHWKGAQEIVQRQAELFQNRLKTAVRRLTGAEVRFSTPDVALVHATWDVTGSSRPTGEAVPVLKEITTITMVKTNGKWLITAFQKTEGGDQTKKEQNLLTRVYDHTGKHVIRRWPRGFAERDQRTMHPPRPC